ncbi:MAG TPA: hypothetical protein VD994_03545 [Prosthecobacter sp.]|nr:hypothetical protein [Prosthecobacter sp.]
MFPLNLLQRNAKAAAIGALILLVVTEAGIILRQYGEIKRTRIAYENPQVKEAVREVKIQGPERIVYRTVRAPGQVEEKIVYRDRIVTVRESGRESAPVPINKVMTPTRTDRWLLSAGANRVSKGIDGKALLVGYGWRNRFDLQAGVVNDEEVRPWVVATLRF